MQGGEYQHTTVLGRVEEGVEEDVGGDQPVQMVGRGQKGDGGFYQVVSLVGGEGENLLQQ